MADDEVVDPHLDRRGSLTAKRLSQRGSEFLAQTVPAKFEASMCMKWGQ